jgi:hypothetical protein
MMILSLSDSGNNGLMMLMLVLCATVIMIVLLRRHQFRGTSRREMARDHVSRIRDQHRLRQSMDELLVQLEEASRRVGAQIDTKFAKLETVIQDADDRLARLEHVLGRLGGEKAASRASAGGRSTRPASITRTPPTSGAEKVARNSPGRSPGEAPDPSFERVYELIDAGASPLKTAEQLGLPLGEVELILNLRKLR